MQGAVFPAGSGLGSVGLPAHPSTRSYTCFRFCFHSSFIICRSKNNHCQILYMMIPFVFLLYTEKTFFVNRANVYILQSNLYFYTFRPVSSTVNRWHKKCNNICNDTNRKSFASHLSFLSMHKSEFHFHFQIQVNTWKCETSQTEMLWIMKTVLKQYFM